MKCLKPYQACWALSFTQFNFQISYQRSSRNGKAGALSRKGEDTSGENPALAPLLTQANFLLGTWEQDSLSQVHQALPLDPYAGPRLGPGALPDGQGHPPPDI